MIRLKKGCPRSPCADSTSVPGPTLKRSITGVVSMIEIATSGQPTEPQLADIQALGALHLVRALSSFTAALAAESDDKATRLGPFSAQCRAGNVKILRVL